MSKLPSAEVIELPANAFISRECWDFCKSCKQWDDLRFGACFKCSDHIVTKDGWVWDLRNPEIKWRVDSE